MGPPSYVRSVVGRNVVTRRTTVSLLGNWEFLGLSVRNVAEQLSVSVKSLGVTLEQLQVSRISLG